jgi:hypothetical protein
MKIARERRESATAGGVPEGHGRSSCDLERSTVQDTSPIDPEKLPAVFPVQTCSRVIGIGKNTTYELIQAGQYPVRVLKVCGRYKVSKFDLLAYLGAPVAEQASERAS